MALQEQIQERRSADVSPAGQSIGAIWVAVAVGIAYFLAARLSLFLLAKPDGVAVFWPAAGISSGILIAFGRKVRWPVAVGTIAATIVANLTSDRTIWSASAFALCNAGEALFVAWLIERYFGAEFNLGKLRQVLGLLAAAIIGTAVSGGPNVMLNAAATQAIAMTLHELATNAAKYGALSTPGGQVLVSWERVIGNGAAAKLILKWCETGGPIVGAPPRPGFGTNLIRDLIPHELSGTVDLVFRPDGVCCSIEVSL